jgi:hypothetical protein
MKLRTYGPKEFLINKIMEEGSSELKGVSLSSVTVSVNPTRDYYGNPRELHSLRWIAKEPNFSSFLKPDSMSFFCRNGHGENLIFHKVGDKVNLVVQRAIAPTEEFESLVLRSQKILLEVAELLGIAAGQVYLNIGVATIEWESMK